MAAKKCPKVSFVTIHNCKAMSFGHKILQTKKLEALFHCLVGCHLHDAGAWIATVFDWGWTEGI
jgi:hypothetical protein